MTVKTVFVCDNTDNFIVICSADDLGLAVALQAKLELEIQFVK